MIFPQRSEIEWLSGWGEMGSYKFATGNKVHRILWDVWELRVY